MKVSLFVFKYQTMRFFFLLFYFEKNVKKLSTNFKYSKSQKPKKLSVLRPDLRFLQKMWVFTNVSQATAKLSTRKKDDTDTSLSFSSRTSLWYSKKLRLLDNCVKQVCVFFKSARFLRSSEL